MKKLKKLYNWVLSWAHSPYGTWGLFGISFAESSFFPVPPDVLQIALSLSLPKKSYFYALISAIASVLGGIAGYAIGLYLMEFIGWPILRFYGLIEEYTVAKNLFHQYGGWAIAIAGFTPIPYKLFTIASGAFGIQLWMFVWVSALSRSARFFLVATLIYFFGNSVKSFIDKYFNILTITFFILFILGWFVIKLLIS